MSYKVLSFKNKNKKGIFNKIPINYAKSKPETHRSDSGP